MKLIISVISTALLSFIVGLYTPWWSIAIVAFVVALLIQQPPSTSFCCGFLGVFVTWFMLALFINAANGGILANRIGAMLGIGQKPILLAFISALVGGLVAGFAALSASYLRGNRRSVHA